MQKKEDNCQLPPFFLRLLQLLPLIVPEGDGAVEKGEKECFPFNLRGIITVIKKAEVEKLTFTERSVALLDLAILHESKHATEGNFCIVIPKMSLNYKGATCVN